MSAWIRRNDLPSDLPLDDEVGTLARALATADSNEGIRAFWEHCTSDFRPDIFHLDLSRRR